MIIIFNAVIQVCGKTEQVICMLHTSEERVHKAKKKLVVKLTVRKSFAIKIQRIVLK